MRLKNKVAVVTGAAQGIGLGVAQCFAAEGARVMALDINEQVGSNAITSVAGASFFCCDISDKAAVDATIADIIADAGKVDICVNNAGILRSGDALEISEEDFDAVLSVNLKGAFLVSQAVGRHMVVGGSGSIINMSAVNGVMTISNILPYNVSKGGLDQLTRVMAVALADKSVRVNAIGPGSILTKMLEQVMSDDTKRRAILSRTPMGRCGSVDEIAQVATFLASNDSSYITGQCIYADGGRLALNYTVPIAD